MQLVDYLRHHANTQPTKVAVKHKVDGGFCDVSWRELADLVLATAIGLHRFELPSGSAIGLVGGNSFSLLVTDLAIQSAGYVVVPLGDRLSASQATQLLEHAEVKAVIASDTCSTTLKLEEFCNAANIPRLALSLPHMDHHPDSPSLPTPTLDGDSLAAILYTSGSTGSPRGVMLSHGNLTSNAQGLVEMFADEATDIRLCFLPWNHAFARTADLGTWLVRGSTIAIAESRDTIVADCHAVQPKSMNGVPYFFERIYNVLKQGLIPDEPDSVRQLLGGRLEFCTCGGAALSPQVKSFWQQQGIPILEGYGLTEASPVVTTQTLRDLQTDQDNSNVGRCLPNGELKLAGSTQEILVRGPHVMLGYWKDEAATSAKLQEGWLHTGDTGELDDAGNLRITGRLDDDFSLSTGYVIHPARIESVLESVPTVQRALVFGEGQPAVAALIWLQPWATETSHEELRTAFLELQQGMWRQHCVEDFRIIAEPLTPESGLLTATFKLKRKAIVERYAG